MSWKMYALGTQGSATNISKLASEKLSELGFTASYTEGNYQFGTLHVTVDGSTYTGLLYIDTSVVCPYYLCVNDETNEVLVTCAHNSASTTSSLNYIFNFGLLRGTSAETGSEGLFVLTPNRTFVTGVTNLWYTGINSGDSIMLHRAAFSNATSNNDKVTNVPFMSTVFWGSTRALTPGTAFTIGADSFVCLGNYLYAKL